MCKILISPSILSGDFVNMKKSVSAISDWGGDLVHCDVMDGVYVSNLTFGMPMVSAIKKITSLPLDVHLMITRPEKYIDAFIEAGADYLTFHPDASESIECARDALKKIQSKGVKSGIVFNPNIKFKDYSELMYYCDIVLIMSVYAGYGGQKFIPESLDKVSEAKEFIKKNKLNIPIEIDGGITESNAKAAIDAGVTILVAGSAIYKSVDPRTTIKKLKLEIE
ncbi:MAG: ribulose-phosphate 3-epimerase [Christensenellaceae bacterium]|jgi:ribulose-phosphate 3-epimerase|nr:ribulose-phosphate 3-epimerase [Christensenellaceae bacterium]